MTAEEARKKTDNPISLENVLSAIENDVNNGIPYHITPINLLFSAEIIAELIKLGYGIHQRYDQLTGLPFYVITWS